MAFEQRRPNGPKKEYDETNRGAIWRNDKKTRDEDADYTGSLNVDGRDHWINAWKPKRSDNPKTPVLRFSIKAKDQARRDSYERSRDHQAPPARDDFDEFDR